QAAAVYVDREHIRQKVRGEPFDTSARVRRHRQQAAPRCKRLAYLRRLFPTEGPSLPTRPDPLQICGSPGPRELARASSFPAKPTNQVGDLSAARFHLTAGIDRRFSWRTVDRTFDFAERSIGPQQRGA